MRWFELDSDILKYYTLTKEGRGSKRGSFVLNRFTSINAIVLGAPDSDEVQSYGARISTISNLPSISMPSKYTHCFNINNALLPLGDILPELNFAADSLDDKYEWIESLQLAIYNTLFRHFQRCYNISDLMRSIDILILFPLEILFKRTSDVDDDDDEEREVGSFYATGKYVNGSLHIRDTNSRSVFAIPGVQHETGYDLKSIKVLGIAKPSLQISSNQTHTGGITCNTNLVLRPDQQYTILMINPDFQWKAGDSKDVFIHWLVVNSTLLTPDQSLSCKDNLCDYLPPCPTYNSGKNRILLMVFQQYEAVDTKIITAMEGGKFDRCSDFSLNEFHRSLGLGPLVALNCFTCQWEPHVDCILDYIKFIPHDNHRSSSSSKQIVEITEDQFLGILKHMKTTVQEKDDQITQLTKEKERVEMENMRLSTSSSASSDIGYTPTKQKPSLFQKYTGMHKGDSNSTVHSDVSNNNNSTNIVYPDERNLSPPSVPILTTINTKAHIIKPFNNIKSDGVNEDSKDAFVEANDVMPPQSQRNTSNGRSRSATTTVNVAMSFPKTNTAVDNSMRSLSPVSFGSEKYIESLGSSHQDPSALLASTTKSQSHTQGHAQQGQTQGHEDSFTHSELLDFCNSTSTHASSAAPEHHRPDSRMSHLSSRASTPMKEPSGTTSLADTKDFSIGLNTRNRQSSNNNSKRASTSPMVRKTKTYQTDRDIEDNNILYTDRGSSIAKFESPSSSSRNSISSRLTSLAGYNNNGSSATGAAAGGASRTSLMDMPSPSFFNSSSPSEAESVFDTVDQTSGVFNTSAVSSHSLAVKYAASLGTNNTEIFNGVWALKKLSYESAFRKRFIFIDPSQGTFHWKKSDKVDDYQKLIRMKDSTRVRLVNSAEGHLNIEMKSGPGIDIKVDNVVEWAMVLEKIRIL